MVSFGQARPTKDLKERFWVTIAVQRFTQFELLQAKAAVIHRIGIASYR